MERSDAIAFSPGCDAALTPPLDARMEDDSFTAFLDVPDLMEPPVVALGPDRLRIEGRRKPGRAFARDVALPPGVDRDRLELDYLAGTLRVFIPRSGSARTMPRPSR